MGNQLISLHERRKRIAKRLAAHKKKLKQGTLLKKSKEGQRFGGHKSFLKKKEAEKREAKKKEAKKREAKKKLRRKRRRHFRREMYPVQLVSGDTIGVPMATTTGNVEVIEKPVEYVSGELYNSMFAFNIESPIQVDSQLWDSIKENLPDNYMIPDSEFIEAVCVDDLPKEITSAMNPVLVQPIAQPIDAPLETSLSEPESQPYLTKVDGAE